MSVTCLITVSESNTGHLWDMVEWEISFKHEISKEYLENFVVSIKI